MKYAITITMEDGIIIRSDIKGDSEKAIIDDLILSQFNTIIGSPTLVFNRSKIITIQSKEIPYD